ncbi:MAG: ATP-grasp domain-containing protein [Gemmataceae bacterium]
MSRGPLLIVGASGRAAAAWALRRGYEPFVIDLFADEDTRQFGPVFTCPFEEYPHGFIERSRLAPAGPWLYTGGLENAPEVVAAISRERRLIGNGPDVLSRVRDPFHVQDVCRRIVVAYPQTISMAEWRADPSRTQSRWLKKSLRSSGGLGVRTLVEHEHEHEQEEQHGDGYAQEFIDGDAMSVLFESDGNRRVKLLGVTRQLIGQDWLHAKPFSYCGNLSRKSEALEPLLRSIGERFTRLWNLRGIWGVDFIERNGEPVVIEINPRFTASMDVLDDLLPASAEKACIGKAVYYAPFAFRFPHEGPWLESLARCRDVKYRPTFADIPAAGFPVQAGQPVLTLLCESRSENEAIHTLKAHANDLDQRFLAHCEDRT